MIDAHRENIESALRVCDDFIPRTAGPVFLPSNIAFVKA
tara:strand:+ start:1564 stop:1680 length:117 start_codon:yes stop_codon:yes gene_type:complete